MERLRKSRAGSNAGLLAMAAGHAAVVWLFVSGLSLVVGDAGPFGHPLTVLLSGFAAWLICAGRAGCPGIWRFVLAGYLTVALDVAATLAVAATAMMGRFDLSATATAIAATLPWAMPVWGTLMAAVSAAYGLSLNRLQAPRLVERRSKFFPGETRE